MAALDKTKKHARRPLRLQLLIALIRLLGVMAPPLAVRILYRMWIHAPRFGEPRREQHWRKAAQSAQLEHRLGPIALYQWGDIKAPYVLLVHGWSGRGTQLGAFAAPLVEAGYGVLAFDAPGHGRSPGTSTTIFEINEVFRAIYENFGEPHAVIAHSFGVVVTCYNLNHGLHTDKVVCLSAPSKVTYLVDHFAQILKLSPALKARFLRFGERRFGSGVWQEIDPDRNVAELDIPALLIHDRNDEAVPHEHSERLAQVWTGSRLYLTRGLGHRRLLRDARTIDEAVRFIREG